MQIKNYEDYQKEIKPMEMMANFNRLVKKNKPKDKDLYVPPCRKFSKVNGKNIPIIVVKSIYGGNYYEIPLSEIISIEKLMIIDFNLIDYTACKYLKNLPKEIK